MKITYRLNWRGLICDVCNGAELDSRIKELATKFSMSLETDPGSFLSALSIRVVKIEIE